MDEFAPDRYINFVSVTMFDDVCQQRGKAVIFLSKKYQSAMLENSFKEWFNGTFDGQAPRYKDLQELQILQETNFHSPNAKITPTGIVKDSFPTPVHRTKFIFNERTLTAKWNCTVHNSLRPNRKHSQLETPYAKGVIPLFAWSSNYLMARDARLLEISN